MQETEVGRNKCDAVVVLALLFQMVEQQSHPELSKWGLNGTAVEKTPSPSTTLKWASQAEVKLF